ncbi:MAG: hypothetical protein ICV83_04480 [Cytophagales bacterium]|nr:hypothetical protein [Cytophagales bacterium]
MKARTIITLYLILAGSIAFAQPDPSCKACISKKDTLDGQKVYDWVEKWPEFRGGMTELTKFLGSHLKYSANEEGETLVATVIVTFIVDVQGRIKNPCV